MRSGIPVFQVVHTAATAPIAVYTAQQTAIASMTVAGIRLPSSLYNMHQLRPAH